MQLYPQKYRDMEELDYIGKMLDTIHKMQESTKEIPVVQSEIKNTLKNMGSKMQEAHLALTDASIKDIRSDQNLQEEEKEKLIRKLNEDKAIVMGLF